MEEEIIAYKISLWMSLRAKLGFGAEHQQILV